MKRDLQCKKDIADSIARIEALTRDTEIMLKACVERQKHGDAPGKGTVSDARQYLESRGVDPTALLDKNFPSLDELEKLGAALYGDFHKRLEEEYHDAMGCDGVDYAVAAFSGVLSGVIDILWVGMPGDSALGLGVDALSDKLVVGLSNLMARPKNSKGKRVAATKSVKTAIARLERVFKINYDQTSKAATGGLVGLSPRNHHLLSMAHAPDWIGLLVAIINQFTDTSTFVSDGHVITIDTETFELKGHTVPAKLFSAVINWFGHMVSDFNGSSSTKRVKGGHSGAGLCPPFYELTQICGFGSIGESKQTIAELAEAVYKEGYDLRHFATCAIPVLLNELIVRFFWALRQHCQFHKTWRESVPSANQPAVSRMLLVSYGCLCTVDAVDAAVRCGGVPLAFFLRCNLVAWYRLAQTSVGELKIYFQKERMMFEFHESKIRKDTKVIREKYGIADEDIARCLEGNRYSSSEQRIGLMGGKNERG